VGVYGWARAHMCARARVYLSVYPLIVARQRPGKIPRIVARQQFGKNPSIVARQRFDRNVTAVANTHTQQ
jgi:hypothetical protein